MFFLFYFLRIDYIKNVVMFLRPFLWILNGLLFLFLMSCKEFGLAEIFGLIHIGNFKLFFTNVIHFHYSNFLCKFLLYFCTIVQILIELLYLLYKFFNYNFIYYVVYFIYLLLLVGIILVGFYVLLVFYTFLISTAYTAVNYVWDWGLFSIKIDRFF